MEVVTAQPPDNVPEGLLKANKLAKIPTFEGADGYTLHECIAIAVYGTSARFSVAVHSHPPYFRG